MLAKQIFGHIWYYQLVGVICFFFGGMLSYFFVLDPLKWKSVLEPDDKSLLKMIQEKQYAYVDRVIGNGVCTVKDIIERTLLESSDCLTDEDCRFLLCEMIRRGVVMRKGNANSSRYENNVMAALLINDDDSPYHSKESELASLVLKELREGISVKTFSYEDIRNAGASFTFLRFHLNATPEFFKNFTADELYKEKFDLLFCLQCEFTSEDLIKAGFKEEYVKHQVFADLKICNLSKLKETFGYKLLDMQFYVLQLRACEDILDEEIMEWFKIYKETKLGGTGGTSIVFAPISKDDRKRSEPVQERRSSLLRPRGQTDAIQLFKNGGLTKDDSIWGMSRSSEKAVQKEDSDGSVELIMLDKSEQKLDFPSSKL